MFEYFLETKQSLYYQCAHKFEFDQKKILLVTNARRRVTQGCQSLFIYLFTLIKPAELGRSSEWPR